MKQSQIINADITIKTEQGNYPITITYHNFPKVNLATDHKSIERYINQLENILKYYKVKEVNLLYTPNQIVWILLFNLKEKYALDGVTITEEMAYSLNRDLEIFMDGGYPNIGIQNFEAGLDLWDPLTITVCYDNK